MSEKLLILSGLKSCGCLGSTRKPKMRRSTKMRRSRGRCLSYRNVYNPRTRKYVKRCVRRGSVSMRGIGMGSMGKVSDSLKSMIGTDFNAIRDVAVTAVMAAGGAIITEKFWSAFGNKVLKLAPGSNEENIAIGVSGLALGIITTKLLKKPHIGTAFAVGALTLASLRIMGKLLNSGVSGLGYIAVDKPGFQPELYPGVITGQGVSGMGALGFQDVTPAGFQPQANPNQFGYSIAA